jgi:hypothetical protein
VGELDLVNLGVPLRPCEVGTEELRPKERGFREATRNRSLALSGVEDDVDSAERADDERLDPPVDDLDDDQATAFVRAMLRWMACMTRLRGAVTVELELGIAGARNASPRAGRRCGRYRRAWRFGPS